jgi:hypothetical protein
MALTKNARNKLFKLVQQSKKLLYQEITEQLQQHYGIFADSGKVVLVEELTTSEADVIHKAKLLRDRLKYLASNLADKKNEAIESIEQLIREQAFTILNRLAALRMAEERGIVRETISKGYTSEGFQVYDSITGQGGTTSTYFRYKWYLNAVFDELALDLPSIFDRFSPYAIIFPGERSLLEMLNLINDEELIAHREEGFSAINLWQQDEAIGWIYQYYNGREEISIMREASAAPRNSRELAVRNQFFTPRYVVQFLTDNSLGKIWYEMTKGNTSLKDACPYLINPPKELFLNKGENIPLESESDVQYIEYREIKDPREIKMLDPACGSMHFGLYAFDLMEIIYQEAWDNHQELLTDLKNSMTRADYMNQVPEFIIRYNIHGVDIDPRALQIAALSLWLRAQKSFDKLKIEPSKRPQIKKSNLVIAEPMPVNQEFLSELVKPLDAPMRKLVIEIWDLMKLAGETGLLLRIEHEIDNKIQEIVRELSGESKNSQITIGANAEQLLAAEQSALYATKKYRIEFLDTAEKQVLEILKSLAENANNDNAYQKLLFADDSARGFAFIELCRNRYDVIVMNPPFGSSSINTKIYIDNNYPTSKNDLASVFIERMLELLYPKSFLGSITTRTIFFLGTYTNWRSKYLIDENKIKYFIDLGGGVLDAMVETATYIVQKGISSSKSIFFRATKDNQKETKVNQLLANSISKDVYEIDTENFKVIPNEPFCYWVDKNTLKLFLKENKFENGPRGARKGVDTPDNFSYIRNSWEVNIKSTDWKELIFSDYSSRFYIDLNAKINWKKDGYLIRNFSTIRNEKYFNQPGLSWALRTARFEPHIIPSGYIIYQGRFLATFQTNEEILSSCTLFNSEYFDYMLKLSMEKDYQPKFINGIVNQLPYPKLTNDLKVLFEKIAIRQFKRIKNLYSLNDTSLSFSCRDFIKYDSVKAFIMDFKTNIEQDKKCYQKDCEKINNEVYSMFSLKLQEIEDIKEIIHKSESSSELKAFEISESELFNKLISILVGCAFQRWDLRILINLNSDWLDNEIFKYRKHSPFLFGQNQSIYDLVLVNFHGEIMNILKKEYPIKCLKEYATTDELAKKIQEIINLLWMKSASKIEFELLDHFKTSLLESVFTNYNNFFDSHIKEYTMNKRISPIYWPISSSNGNYTIYLYYTNLNDQTLISVINNHLQPKIDSITEAIRQFSNNPNLDNKGLKELKYLQDFQYELEEMKKEIISITSLPYKPNHNDGVLITAAPLYKLFRHAKWRKSTEECWKALEKGEYDWAHLAYSIWPERVVKKCKKDYSMAIAHGLENICENKPKEKKAKEKKEPKETKKNLKLNLE